MPVSRNDIEAIAEAAGARFANGIDDFSGKLANIKAFILDWDGVFNAGIKADDTGSPFSEVDSMGLNMLRFGFYLRHGFIPAIYIVTGENNQAALKLSAREHFGAVYIKIRDKRLALEHIQAETGLQAAELAFIYDDILDLGVAGAVGLRFYVQRPANPMLNTYVAHKSLADYYTGNTGKDYAVREISEMILAVLGNYDDVIGQRVGFSQQYRAYLEKRNEQPTLHYTLTGDRITEYPIR